VVDISEKPPQDYVDYWYEGITPENPKLGSTDDDFWIEHGDKTCSKRTDQRIPSRGESAQKCFISRNEDEEWNEEKSGKKHDSLNELGVTEQGEYLILKELWKESQVVSSHVTVPHGQKVASLELIRLSIGEVCVTPEEEVRLQKKGIPQEEGDADGPDSSGSNW